MYARMLSSKPGKSLSTAGQKFNPSFRPPLFLHSAASSLGVRFSALFLFELVFDILICFLFRTLCLPLLNSWFKLLLKFFNGIRPLDWFGLLIIICHKVCDCLFQRLETLKVIRLQALPLQNTEPNLH